MLVGGQRVVGTNVGSGPLGELGVLTKRLGVLSNDFFVNMLDLDTAWKVYASADGKQRFLNDRVAAWTKVMPLHRFDLWPSIDRIC